MNDTQKASIVKAGLKQLVHTKGRECHRIGFNNLCESCPILPVCRKESLRSSRHAARYNKALQCLSEEDLLEILL